MKAGILGAAIAGFFAIALVAQAATIYSQGATGAFSTSTVTFNGSYTLNTTGPVSGTIKSFGLNLSFSRWNNVTSLVVPFDSVTITINCPSGGVQSVYNMSASHIPFGDDPTPPDTAEVKLVPSAPISASGVCAITMETGNATAITLGSNGGTPYFEAYDTVGDPPVVSNVSISSTNASTSLAKAGDTVNVTFSTDVDISNAAVTIGTQTATIATTSVHGFTASAALDGSNADGPLPFSITTTNTLGDSNAAVTSATDGSSVTFDTTAPVITITGGVIATFASSSPVSISFTNDDANASTSCSFDTDATSTCAGSASATLADGIHSVFFSSTDAAGNVGTTSLDFTVDATAPTLSITAGPADGSTASSTEAAFEFDAELGAMTSCIFDGATTTPCTSPQIYSALLDGSHTFTVVASDPVGNSASSSITFTVDATAPALAETNAIGTTTDTTPEYAFTSSEAGTVTYSGSCSSSAPFAVSGTNTITLDTLSVGTYSDCTITVTDAAGNASAALSITTFEIAALPPPPPSNNGGGNGGGGGNGPPIQNGKPTSVIPTVPNAPAPSNSPHISPAPILAPASQNAPIIHVAAPIVHGEVSKPSENESIDSSSNDSSSQENPQEPASQATVDGQAASPATSGASFPAWALFAFGILVVVGGGFFFGKKLIS